jgi:hypothetical protein
MAEMSGVNIEFTIDEVEDDESLARAVDSEGDDLNGILQLFGALEAKFPHLFGGLLLPFRDIVERFLEFHLERTAVEADEGKVEGCLISRR